VDERELEHAEIVFGGLLKAREDATVFFEPAKQPLDDVAVAVRFAVEFHRPAVPILVGLRGNDGSDALTQQVFIDPVGAEAFVASQVDGAQRLAFLFAANDRSGEQRFQGLRLVRLPGGDVDVERMAVSVAEQMDFCRKPASRAA